MNVSFWLRSGGSGRCWSTTAQSQKADIRVPAMAAATILVLLPLDGLWWRALGVI